MHSPPDSPPDKVRRTAVAAFRSVQAAKPISAGQAAPGSCWREIEPVRQHKREQKHAQQPAGPVGPPIVLSIRPRWSTRLPCSHPRKGGHAGKTGREATMCLTTSWRGRSFFQHLLDEIDSARGLSSRRREAHRSDRVAVPKPQCTQGERSCRLGDIGIGEMSQAEFGLHAAPPVSSGRD